jgi:hypothetical protein
MYVKYIGLESLFAQYCPSGDMDSKGFMKLIKDSELIDSKFGTGDVDLVFQKAKTKEAGGNVQGKRVSYRTFVAICLPGIANKKGLSIESIIAVFMKSEGPKLTNVTEAEAVRFHDDKSTYTGTHVV